MGGALLIRGGEIRLEGESILQANTLGESPRAPGGITIDATGTVMLVEGSLVFTGTEGRSDAGDIMITARNMILREGSIIGSLTVGPGDSGNVTIRVRDTLTVNGSPSLITAQASPGASGSAGNVVIEAVVLTIAEGGQISSITFGVGNGGKVTIQVRETLTVTGADVDGSSSGIAAQTGPGASGSAGNVVIETAVLTIAAGGRIGSGTFGMGDGGNMTIRVHETLTVTGANPVNGLPSGISAQANSTASGSGGHVLIEASALTLAEGGQIGSSTFGPGDGGSVTIRVRDTFTVTGSDPVNDSPSVIFVSTIGSGQGGEITVNARRIRLTEGAQIDARSAGTGNAGDITITALDTFVSENSVVRTGARQADGGDIRLTAQGLMQLSNSQITTSAGSGEGAGGNITVDSVSILLQDSQLRADAFGGAGGNIQITADAFLADPISEVSASSDLGIDGEIDIQAPIADLIGIVTPLPPDFASAGALLSNRCAARLWEGTVSSFAVVGRDSVPATPDEPLPSQLYRPRSAPGTQAETGQQPKGALHIDTTQYPHDTPWLTLVMTPVTPGLDCAKR